MNCKLIKTAGTWRDVADAARTTIRMDEGTGEPSLKWKRSMLLAEHSPIRKLIFNWKWYDLPYWVSVHFVRHKFGIEHFVSTQRTDRTGINRAAKSQSAPVVHECFANAQALIFMARRRLCSCASPETRQAMQALKDEVAKVDTAVASCMVRECVYRGFCPEARTCGYVETQTFVKEHLEYTTMTIRGESK